MNIHEIGETWRKLEDMLESGEISQQTYEDTVEAALKDAEPAKIESYCDYINDLKGAIAARDKRKGELEKANKTAASRIEWLEGRLRWLLEYTGRSVIKGLTYEVALRKAGVRRKMAGRCLVTRVARMVRTAVMISSRSSLAEWLAAITLSCSVTMR